MSRFSVGGDKNFPEQWKILQYDNAGCVNDGQIEYRVVYNTGAKDE